MDILTTIGGIGEIMGSFFNNFMNVLFFTFLIGFVVVGYFIIFLSKKHDYILHIYSHRGAGLVCDILKGRHIGKQGEVEKLYILETKETIQMPDTKYLYPYGKKYLINLYRDVTRELHPIELVSDENENILLKINEQDTKFWFINDKMEEEMFRKGSQRWRELLPVISLIILALIFIFFLYYANKTHSEDMMKTLELQKKLIDSSDRISENLKLTANALSNYIMLAYNNGQVVYNQMNISNTTR